MTRGTKPLAALLLGLAIAGAATAEESASARALTALVGDWQGEGTTSDMPSKQRLHWETVLGGQFVRLTLDNRMETPDGKEWHFQAQALYRVLPDGTIAGTWFDSRGFTFPLKGRADDSGVLTIDWGSDDTERGLSRYRIENGRLEVTDEVQDKDGTIRVFGRSTLERQP
jgi:hypothetical protein